MFSLFSYLLIIRRSKKSKTKKFNHLNAIKVLQIDMSDNYCWCYFYFIHLL